MSPSNRAKPSNPRPAVGLEGSDRRQPSVRSVASDAKLSRLLAEPETRLIMRADGVDERELLKTLSAISAKLGERPRGDRTRQSIAEASMPRPGILRPGVGAFLINSEGQVFVGRRRGEDVAGWQLPQGGIHIGESPQAALRRELFEELGIEDFEIVRESAGWHHYEVPQELAHAAWAGRWLGQRQKWFLVIFRGENSAINVATEHPEFDAWRWVSPDDLPELAVSFKRQLYLGLLEEFRVDLSDALRGAR
jgi:putative (di)nucleoside polyphosphate hydrolase